MLLLWWDGACWWLRESLEVELGVWGGVVGYLLS
jgi:hypothetical protein